MGGLSFFPNNELVVHLKHLCDVYIYIYFLKKCVRGYLVGIHGNMIITVYSHLFMLSLLSEIVYNVLQKGC